MSPAASTSTLSNPTDDVLSIIGEHFARAPSIPQLFPPRAPVTMGTCIFALRKKTRGLVQLSPCTQGWRLLIALRDQRSRRRTSVNDDSSHIILPILRQSVFRAWALYGVPRVQFILAESVRKGLLAGKYERVCLTEHFGA